MATPCRVRLNVGGKVFMTTADTLRSLPDTRLGRLAGEDPATPQQELELFFDRNPKIINSLLDLYRTGELHVPKSLCARTVERELEFWGVPKELIRECCFRGFQEHKEDAEITAEIDQFLRFPYDTAEDCQQLSRLGRVWLMMERPGTGLASKIWAVIFFSVVFYSVILYCLSTVMSYRTIDPRFEKDVAGTNVSVEDVFAALNLLEKFFVTLPYPWIQSSLTAVFVFFLLEFLVGFLCCPVKAFFVKQTRNWLDVLLLVHHAVEIVLEYIFMNEVFHFSKAETDALVFFYSFTAMKLLRVLYITLFLSAKASLKVLTLLTICVLSLSILYGTLLYLAGLLTGHFTFTTIPHAMWYAVVTMTTVGYGDVVPGGLVGRVLGMACAFTGLVTIALPIAVVASNFSKYHDNLACRTQLRRRLGFVKDRPEGLLHNDGGGGGGGEERGRDKEGCPRHFPRNKIHSFSGQLTDGEVDRNDLRSRDVNALM